MGNKITCPNCKATLGCGCQRLKAKDGKTVCTYCVNKYNNSLKDNTTPTVSITYSDN